MILKNDIKFQTINTPDGLIASASDDATIRLWRRDGKLIKILKRQYHVGKLPEVEYVEGCS